MCICIYHFLLKHMISTYSSITGCNFDLLPLFSLSSGGKEGGVGMCFVGKSEGSAKASSRKANSRKAPSRERDWVGVSGSLPL